MKYCVECGSEYQDAVTECADCPGSGLVEANTMRRMGLPLPGEQDSRRFVRAATAEDPLSAEQLVRTLEEERIPVLARPRRAGTVDLLTTGVVHPWWEILVTEEHAARAAELLSQASSSLEATREEASRAVDEEVGSTPQGERTTASSEGWRGA